eukprot:1509-Heterococcus_DN1.PRE.3
MSDAYYSFCEAAAAAGDNNNRTHKTPSSAVDALVQYCILQRLPAYPRRLLSRQESGGLNLLQCNQCKHVNKKSVNRYKSHEMSAHDACADTS